MKKLLVVGCLLLMAGMAKADMADFTSSEEIQSATITNSSWTWTRVPSSSDWNDKKRVAIWFDLDNSCTDYLLYSVTMDDTHGPNYGGTPYISETSTGTAYGDTTEGLKYKETDGPAIISIPHNLYLWMNVQGDGSETLYYQQLRGNK